MQSLLFFIYDLIFGFVFLFYLPIYFFRKKITFSSLKERFGFSPFFFDKSIWLHAVSLGEVNLVEPLVKKLKETLSDPIVISTTTLTGNQVAQEKYSRIAKVVYFPFDLSFVVKKFIKKINPKIFIAVETEIWPNLTRQLKKRGIPFVIVNGRISGPAFRRYKRIRFLMKRVLSGCSRIGVQSGRDKRRFLALGASAGKLLVTGNLKFNVAAPAEEKIRKQREKFEPILKLNSKNLFLAASTHHPEEEIILDIYRQIKERENLVLLIAPRHPERVPKIEELVRAKGFTPVLISQTGRPVEKKEKVFILDTVGSLIYFYSFSDVCFVGGSFSQTGGHNILEPIYFSKPVLFGPGMDNFSQIAKIALDSSAAIQVNSPGQLKEKLLLLLKDREKRLAYSKASAEVFKENKSLAKSLKIILEEINA